MLRFAVEGVAAGAFSGLAPDAALTVDTEAASLLDAVCAPEAGLPADAQLQLGVSESVKITGPSTVELESKAIQLPDGREFSAYLLSGFETVENASDASVTALLPAGSLENYRFEEISLAPGATLNSADVYPGYSAALEYQVDGGAWTQAEASRLGSTTIELPAGTPADAAVDLRIVSPDLSLGYIESSWGGATKRVELANGHAEVSLTLTSNLVEGSQADYSFELSAAEADPEGSVYIDGERYSEAFGFGEGPDGVALSYDEAGSPTVTLDGAHITQASGPVGHDGEYGYRAGIWAAGDLAVRVQGEPSAVVIDELDSPRAISSGGALVIEGDATAAERPTLSLSTRDNLSEDEGAIPEVAYGKTVEVRDVALEAGFERRSSSASSVIVVSSAADVSFERCDVSLFAPEGDAAYSMGVYGSADGGISFVDSNVNTTGDFTRLFVCGKDLVIAGRTQMDLECAAGRADSAIDVGDWANTGSRFVVDLEGADSYVRLNGTADSYPYAVFARGGIELGEHTTLVQPVGGKVGIAQEPFFEYETYTLVDAQGNPAYAFEFAGRDAETPGEGGGESETPAGGSGSDVDATGDSGEKAGFAATGDAAGSIAIASVAAIAAAAVCIRFVRKVCHR